MDNQKAKFILQSWRSDGADTGDSHFDEPLAQAERDPDLAEWFAREQALDAAVVQKLKEVAVPDGLRERLLAEQEEAEVAAPMPSRRTFALLALAASLALLATVAVLFWQRPSSTTKLAAFRQEMLANVTGNIRLAHRSVEVRELTGWLAEQRNISGIVIPEALRNRPGIGCRTWTWNGKPVGLICFLLNGREAVHFFVVDRAAISDAPAGLRPAFTKEGGWTSATWAEGDKLYMLAGHAEEAVLAELL